MREPPACPLGEAANHVCVSRRSGDERFEDWLTLHAFELFGDRAHLFIPRKVLECGVWCCSDVLGGSAKKMLDCLMFLHTC